LSPLLSWLSRRLSWRLSRLPRTLGLLDRPGAAAGIVATRGITASGARSVWRPLAAPVISGETPV